MTRFVRPVSPSVVSRGGSFDDHRNRKPHPSVNPGTDYAVRTGTAVHAVSGGKVVAVDTGPDGSGGRTIALDCDNGSGIDYLHLSKIEVSTGQRVKQGDKLGNSGCSANGFDDPQKNGGIFPHLHLAMRPNHTHFANNGNVDPEKHLVDRATAVLDEGDDMQLIRSKRSGNWYVIPQLGQALKIPKSPNGSPEHKHALAYKAANERGFRLVSSTQARQLVDDLAWRNEQAADLFGWSAEKLAEIKDAIAELKEQEPDEDEEELDEEAVQDLAEDIDDAIRIDVDAFVAKLKATLTADRIELLAEKLK